MSKSQITLVKSKGITDQPSKLKRKIKRGAKRKRPELAALGIIVSLLRSLKASAKAWRIPKSPTTLGPRRLWIPAKTFRSRTVKKATDKIKGKRMGIPLSQKRPPWKERKKNKKNEIFKNTRKNLKSRLVIREVFKKSFFLRWNTRGEIRRKTFHRTTDKQRRHPTINVINVIILFGTSQQTWVKHKVWGHRQRLSCGKTTTVP